MNEENKDWLKSTLVDIENQYLISPTLTLQFLSKEHLTASRNLERNVDVVIFQSDKGSDFVLLNIQDAR